MNQMTFAELDGLTEETRKAIAVLLQKPIKTKKQRKKGVRANIKDV